MKKPQIINSDQAKLSLRANRVNEFSMPQGIPEWNELIGNDFPFELKKQIITLSIIEWSFY